MEVDMAKILIEPAKAKLVLNQQSSLENTLNRLAQDVDSVRGALRFQIAGQQNITQCLRDAAEQISRESQSTQSMRSGLEQIITRYEQAERDNAGRVVAEKTAIQSTANVGGTQQTGSSENTEDTSNWWDNWGSVFPDLLIKELANLVGPFGFLFTGGQKLLDGKWDKALLEVIKSAGKGSKLLIDGPSVSWFKDIVGLTDYTNKGFLKELLGDYSTVGKGIASGVKWVTTIADRMISNAKEGLSTARFWGETVLETAIKVGEGALINWGVGLVAAAVCSNPISLGVSAAAVGVTFLVDWGLDGLTKLVTNGEKTEWVDAVGDWIIDDVGPAIGKAADKLKDAAVKTGEAIVDIGGKAVNAIGKGINSVKNGISNLFSGCKWGKAVTNGAW